MRGIPVSTAYTPGVSIKNETHVQAISMCMSFFIFGKTSTTEKKGEMIENESSVQAILRRSIESFVFLS